MGSWNFDRTTGIITVGTTTYSSEDYVDDTFSYIRVKVKTENFPQAFKDDVQLYIVTDGGDVAANWDEDTTFTATTTQAYKLVNTTSGDFNVDMFDQYGKPLIMRIEYFTY